MRPRNALRAYQEGGVGFIKRVKRCALFVDPGLGKTTTTLTALSEELDDLNLADPVLVIAPPRVAKETWPREFAEWAHLEGRTFTFIGGSPTKRQKLLQRRTDFHVISMDLLPWLLLQLGGDMPRYTKIKAGEVVMYRGSLAAKRFDEKNKPVYEPLVDGDVVRLPGGETVRVQEGKAKIIRSKKAEALEPGDPVKVLDSGWRSPEHLPYGAIVFDESSKLKNSDTTRWKALKQLAFMAEYFIELTGTPAANGLEDLWAQIYLIDQGKRLGTTLTWFRERWFRENYNGFGYKATEGAQAAIEAAIADIVFTLREEDYADLPPRLYNTINVPLDDAVMAKYKDFERSYILDAEDKQIVADGGAALSQKLLQLANGTVYRTDPQTLERTEHEFHKAKLEAMADLVDELQGNTLLVAYQFKTDLARIKKAFPQARELGKKSETQDEWNRGEIPILLVHPKSAAHGLNLQHGGNNVLWYGPTWSLEDYIQLNKRLHRSGQTKPVMVHHLVVPGTLDEGVMAALDSKNLTQEVLLNLLKQRIQSYK